MHEVVLAASLFFATAAAAPATPAPSPKPVDEALLEHLLRVVPVSNAAEVADAAEEAGEIVRLGTLNPGREDDIRAILDAGNACAHALDRQLSTHGIRSAAAALGPDKVARLVRFYETPEARALRDTAHRAKNGAALTPIEKAALARAQAAYPLKEFGLAIEEQVREAVKRGGVDYGPCLDTQRKGLERAGLRTK